MKTLKNILMTATEKNDSSRNSRARSVNTRIRVSGLMVIIAALSVLSFMSSNVHAQISGAVYTTDEVGNVNINFYNNKKDVYLNGGPRKEGAAGLPDGEYYVQVTAPNGILLGTSLLLDDLDGGLSETPVKVINGEFEFPYQLWYIVAYQTVNGGGIAKTWQGYLDTPNNGGEYKVWVSQNRDFVNSFCKTDNFKVKQDSPDPAPPTEIIVSKFYDTNGNGEWDGRDEPDGEQAIPDWHIELTSTGGDLISCGLTDSSGEVKFLVPSDGTDYVVIETLVGSYFNTTDLSVPVTAAIAEKIKGKWVISSGESIVNVVFGNLCLEERFGLGRTPGFWSNNNGREMLLACDPDWRSILNSLSLVWPNGSEIVIPESGDFNAAADILQDALLEPTDSNMAYILTKQLIAVQLNYSCGYFNSPTVVVEVPNWGYADLLDLIAEASDLISEFPFTPGNDQSVAEAREAQAMLKDIFDAINNNVLPIYVAASEPCEFTPVPCPAVE